MPCCEDGSQEGYSDSTPIVLEGEDVDDFAELLSILYALYGFFLSSSIRLGSTLFRPSELHELHSDSANVYRLLAVAQMTNKYHFVTTSAWSISALCQATECPVDPMKQPTLPIVAGPWCRAPILRRIIEVAQLCGHQALCDHTENLWIGLLRNGHANPVYAMDAADALGLARLKGISYYEALKFCNDKLEYVPTSEGGYEERLALSATQKANLLSGFFSLVRRWECIRGSAPSFNRPEGCTYHAHGCLSTWQAVWKSTMKSDAMMHGRTFEVVERLKVLADLFEADRDLRCALTPSCRRAAMDSVRELLAKEQMDLAQHFENLTR